MTSLRLLTVGLASIALHGHTFASEVHVVGPGQQFATIQAAIDVANDFDVIVVKTGTYVGFSVDDRQLAIVGAPGGLPLIVGEMTVENLAAGRSLLLARLHARGQAKDTYALRSRHNLGSVAVERCVLKGPTGSNTFPTIAGTAAWVGFDAQTRFVSTSITGGWAGEVGYLGAGTYEGGEGLFVRSANVELFGCSLVGGKGSSVDEDDGWDGGNGGHALEVPEGNVRLIDCSAIGGSGGWGDWESDPVFCDHGGDGGNGGDGARLGVVGGGAALLLHQDSSFTGGVGGQPGDSQCGGPGNAGQPGLPIRIVNGNSTQLPGPSRYLTGLPVASELQGLSLTAVGAPGDVVRVDVREIGPWLGGGSGYHLLQTRTPCNVSLGTVPASGMLDVQFPVHDLGPNVEARWWSISARFVDAAGVETTAPPFLVVLLDQAI
ncbi:MAG: hypothetical protein L6Q99_04315 [Planctomycetes bacterium]|nr:hypothetical protein [Planctomycetota bacterium]